MGVGQESARACGFSEKYQECLLSSKEIGRSISRYAIWRLGGFGPDVHSHLPERTLNLLNVSSVEERDEQALGISIV